MLVDDQCGRATETRRKSLPSFKLKGAAILREVIL